MSKNKPTKEEIDKSMEQYRLLWKPDTENGMTLTQYNARRSELVQALARFDCIKPSCGHCAHFNMDRCELHGSDVPVSFQKQVGECPEWISSGIPF